MTFANYRVRTPVEIIDASFQMYRAHFGVLVSIAALVTVPPAVISFVLPADWGLVIDRLANLLLPIGQGALSVAGFELLSGRAIGVGEAYKRLDKRLGTLIVVQMVSGLFTVLGLILLIVPGVLVLIWTAVANPVVALEGVSTTGALSRSRQLTRGEGRHVFFTAALAYIVAFALLAGLALGVGLIGGMLGLSPRTNVLLNGVLFAVVLPPLALAIVFLYVDLRVRVEGADIAELASTS